MICIISYVLIIIINSGAKVKKKWLVLVLFSLILISCKDETNVVSSNSQTKGSVKVSLDKNTTPSNVAQVKVTLTREGFTPITGVMNITTDSTASLTLNEITAGTWHVKVDAYNSQQIIVYSGETDANIVSDQITQLNLTLYATTSAMGGISISVKWSDTPFPAFQWQDSPNSPVLSGSLNFEPNGVTDPNVIYENGTYKMWYAGAGYSKDFRIGYAVSGDGINWNKNQTPILTHSYSGWDVVGVRTPKVIKVGNLYKMYYGGITSNTTSKVGLATSPDGVNWTKRPEPVLAPSLSWESSVEPASIIYSNEIYYLFYVDGLYPALNPQICLATSTDGVNFTKQLQPIITPTLGWETSPLCNPSVIYENGKFKMYYLIYGNKNIGYAESIDGKVWTKNPNPVYNISNLTNQWAYGINTLAYVNLDNEIRMYYGGAAGNSSNYYYKIGYIKKN